MPRLCDDPRIGTIGITIERGGDARTRRYRLGSRRDLCGRQERAAQRSSVACGCWRGHCRLPAEVATVQCQSSRLFARQGADPGFEGPSGLGSVIRRSLKRAGINSPTMGAHQFRHGLASEMLRGGASLGEIGEVLGHRHLQTTAIYAKVDLNALRSLAMPWPGEVQ